MRRLVVILGMVLIAALPARGVTASSGGSHVISVTGFSQVDGNPAQVDIMVAVPNGADDIAAGNQALASVGARPLTQAVTPYFALSGFRWRRFFDTNPGNDFVPQQYNATGEPAGGGFLDAFLQAEDTWDGVSSSTFRLKFAGMTKRCPSLLPQCGGKLDGFNDVGWLPLPTRILGVTFTAYNLSNHFIVEADMALNTQVSWFTDQPPAPPSDAIDALSVMTHEDGHVAGLAHSLDPNAVMFANLLPLQIKRTLTADDIDAISTLYPLTFTPLPFEPPGPRTPENPGPPPPDVAVLARLGDTAPGGGTYVNDIEPYTLSDHGNALYAADFCTDAICGEGVYSATDAGATPLARTGDPAPGGGTFGAGVLVHVATNAAGDSSFSFQLDPSQITWGLNAGVYRYSVHSGQLSAVLVPGVTPAPGGGVFAGAEDHTSINRSDTVAFAGIYSTTAGISGGLGTGVFTADTGGTIRPVAVPGDPAPGGGVFDYVALPSMNDFGDVAFSAHVPGADCPAGSRHLYSLFCREGLYEKSSAGLVTAIVRPGDPAPNGGVFRSILNPVINNRGDIAFMGDITPAPHRLRNVGVYLWSGGRITAIATPGTAMPGGGNYMTTFYFPQNLGLNDAGQVSFAAGLNTDQFGLGDFDTGVYRWTDGTLELIARTGFDIQPNTVILSMGFGGLPESGAGIDSHGAVLFQGFVAGPTFTGNELFRVSGPVPDPPRPG